MIGRFERNRARLHPSRGFTLIELLVVISIISMLVAILLPALKKSRESAFAIKCQTQERQIGVAIHSYAVEHKDIISPPFLDYWHFFYDPYLSAPQAPVTSQAYAAVWSCPSHPRSSTAASNSSYLGNVNIIVQDNVPARKMSHLPNPTRNLLVLEHDRPICGTGTKIHGLTTSTVHIYWRHNGNAGNKLFADGHVEARAEKGQAPWNAVYADPLYNITWSRDY